jgi:hypothetical protein
MKSDNDNAVMNEYQPPVRRNPTWPTLMAVKAILLSLAATGAGFVLSRIALPKLTEALHGIGREPSSWMLLGLQYQDLLLFLPAPGLVLGIAALMFRPFRPLIAVLAIIAAIAATAVMVAMLIAFMAPLYEIPRGVGG